MAVGSRYVRGGGIENWSWSRRLISWLGNVYVRLVLGLPVRDATAGFKAYRASALEEIGALTSHSNGYCFQIENTWQAVRRGLVVQEVPITFTDRTHGHSKMSERHRARGRRPRPRLAPPAHPARHGPPPAPPPRPPALAPTPVEQGARALPTPTRLLTHRAPCGKSQLGFFTWETGAGGG